jgi:hypothetical protein
MALQSSGAISLNDMHLEVGGSSGSQVSLNDSDIRDLISKSSGAQSSFSEFYGASAETEVSSGTTINGQSNAKQITASSYVSSGGTLVIPSGFWVWSDSTATPALTIDVSCTVKNYGKIIGKGGAGGNGNNADGDDGGPAIKINSGVTGVSIINYSGAYIAGGGGGAGGGSGVQAGGGGGAGGGNGGGNQYAAGWGYTGDGGAGGTLNATGANGIAGAWPSQGGSGGGAGGGGGSGDTNIGGAGGGGGRILPGTGGSGGGGTPYIAGTGGSAGNNGGDPWFAGGGGGGWGAFGGYGWGYSPGSGGKAINDSGVSYSLTNSGTIYGGT